MVTSSKALNKYGTPNAKAKYMVMWDIPEDINKAIPALPNRLFCNKDLIAPMEAALRNVISRGYAKEIKTFDGCFNIRPMRNKRTGYSLHSWGIAADFNAFENPLNGKGTKFSKGFVKCWTDAGFDWGGNWTVPYDPMHFQLSII